MVILEAIYISYFHLRAPSSFGACKSKCLKCGLLGLISYLSPSERNLVLKCKQINQLLTESILLKVEFG